MRTTKDFELLSPSRAAVVHQDVQKQMHSVARDVTQEGPVAWRRYFDTSPAFVMAVNGQLAFPSGAEAQMGTQRFARTIRTIELKWGTIWC